jgi:hypothetical protein
MVVFTMAPEQGPPSSFAIAANPGGKTSLYPNEEVFLSIIALDQAQKPPDVSWRVSPPGYGHLDSERGARVTYTAPDHAPTMGCVIAVIEATGEENSVCFDVVAPP